tara:strand:+ start:164 stop:484 length:321 start_codon:yes stop_codon:yes gene_type:complete
MIIELNLAQAEEILEHLSEVPKSKTLSDALSTIKEVIKHETEIQVEEIDRIIKRISDNGYKNEDLISNFTKAKDAVKAESTKTKDKYFDEEGHEKGKAKEIPSGKL